MPTIMCFFKNKVKEAIIYLDIFFLDGYIVSEDILWLYSKFINCNIYKHIKVDCKVFI